jgi:hypothetical protein
VCVICSMVDLFPFEWAGKSTSLSCRVISVKHVF